MEWVAFLLFLSVIAILLAGFPVAFTLGGTALVFAGVGVATGAFHEALLTGLPNRVFGIMSNETLVAVPLFVFMGVTLERARIAEELLDTLSGLFGSLRGGLGISVTVVGMLLAASTGIVGATVVTMGLLSLPTMLKRGYSAEISTGTICASGTLGQIIPPSLRRLHRCGCPVQARIDACVSAPRRRTHHGHADIERDHAAAVPDSRGAGIDTRRACYAHRGRRRRRNGCAGSRGITQAA